MATWCSMVLTDSKYIQSLFFFLVGVQFIFRLIALQKCSDKGFMTCILIVASVSKMRLVKLNLNLILTDATGSPFQTFVKTNISSFSL